VSARTLRGSRRLGTGLATALVLLTLGPRAEAQTEDCLPYTPVYRNAAYGSTVQNRLGLGPSLAAARFLETEILSGMRQHDYAFAFDGHGVYDAAEFPAISAGCGQGSLIQAKMDAAFGMVGLGYGRDWWGLFYAAAVNSSMARTDIESAGFRPYGAAFAGFTGLAAPLSDAVSYEETTARARDWMAGIRLALPVDGGVNVLWRSRNLFELTGAFVGGSEGVYAGLELGWLGLSGKLLLTRGFSDLAYLRADLGPIAWSRIDDDLEALGSWRFYAVQTRFASPVSSLLGADAVIPNDAELLSVPFWTANWQISNLFGASGLSALLSLGITPEPFLHRADARWSIGGSDSASFGVSLGYVQMPDLRGYGIDPEGRVHFGADFGVNVGEYDDDVSMKFVYAIDLNDPDTLLLFPAGTPVTHRILFRLEIGETERADGLFGGSSYSTMPEAPAEEFEDPEEPAAPASGEDDPDRNRDD
jgi:hypothetical protein